MATIIVLINVVSLLVNWGDGGQSVAIASLIVALVSFGIFSSFRTNPQAAPNFAVLMSTLSGLAGVVLIIVGLVS